MSPIQQAFLDKLEANEDDQDTRLIYADWLDDNGQHEEAQRQRQWQASKQWLVKFCESCHSEWSGADNYSYHQMIDIIKKGLNQPWHDFINMGANEAYRDYFYLDDTRYKFYEHFSIVTGLSAPPRDEEGSFYEPEWFSFDCSC